MKRLFLLIIVVLCIGAACPGLARAASDNTDSVKELNFVFLHGMGGNSGDLQLLADSIAAQMPAYITNYGYDHPDIKIRTDMLSRCYPNDVDIDTWAHNIADGVNQHFAGKKNLVLIGHSMGGKTALYAVAHNIGNLAEKVAMVVTINSPVKSLENYYYVGGDTALDCWGAKFFLSNQGVLESLVSYDSSQDGQWVSSNKHWLAFVSSESSPLSSQFDVSGVDALPRVMDDLIVPISCQYADGADVVYYGEYEHGDFTRFNQVANYMADQILRYIFGGSNAFSVFGRGGSFEHKADLFPGTDYWEDVVGGVLAGSGTLTHNNDSRFRWQEWEDIVGDYFTAETRSNFQVAQKNALPVLTGVNQSGWVSADDPQDGRLYLSTRAAPGSSVQVDWSIYQKGLLPSGITRDHYEVEIETGAQLASIGKIAWETNDLRDVRLRIWSQTQSPFRWFKAQWRVYYKETHQRQIIDEFPVQSSSE
jgi:pimeloyl-ACP methyl ester carboxylesterase